MGCVSSKQTVSVTPALDHSGILREHNACNGSGCVRGSWSELESGRKRDDYDDDNNNNKYKGRSELGTDLGESGRASSNGESLSFRLGNLQKYVEGEHVAAGWPAWLSAVAGEAIQGWVPLRADAFEKLEKIGQGTYSSVFRARDLDTGKMVALKKVRFDNFEPESVRFMAREILILRRLDHPNIMKLEGIITSRLSCSIYLVFEYMEHDITGLLSCPDIKFSEAQVKCYMKQLLSGLDHCHSHGIMHRDIKGSNLLVNNEGILKIGDFGLANFLNARQRQPLTSRVVTLWYRPPELLLGSTDYDATVDLWSVGCVFAEILRGKPVLQGRTEVEQLHKIFKLCGSPPDDYWKKSRLPHATLFKPQQPYESSLLEFFKDSPKAVVNLISTFLSVEPHKRGTASSALASEYFRIRPFACEPSSLPVYPPNKEIDAKHREDAKRKKGSSRARGADAMRKQTRKPCGTNKLAPSETTILIQDFGTQLKATHNVEANGGHLQILKEGNNLSARERRKLSYHLPENASHVKNSSQEDIPFSGPLPVSSSSGFAWAKRRKDSGPVRSHTRSISRGHIFNEPSAALQGRSNIDSRRHDSDNIPYGVRAHCRGHDSYEIMKCSLQKEWSKFERPDSFEASDEYHSQELSLAHYPKEDKVAKRNTLGYCDQLDKVEFSGPLLSQSHRVDELLERHERHIRQAVRKSWFLKAKKHGK